MAEKRPERTRGSGHDQFWEWCGKGELRLQKCTACSALIWPAAEACEQCGHGEMDWQAMSGKGKVISWCSFHQDYYGGMLPLPYDCILVELDEGVLFLSNPSGFGCEDIEPGMAVVVRFIDCEDGGGVYRLPVFGRV